MNKTKQKPGGTRTLTFSAVPVEGVNPAAWEPARPSDRAIQVLQNVQPYLEFSGQLLVGADANDVGPDDVAGHALLYGGEVIQSVLYGGELPALPSELAAATTGKLSLSARLSISAARGGLLIAQGQLASSHPQAAARLRVVNQVLGALLSGRPVTL